VLLSLAAAGFAQDLDDLREELSRSLRKAQYARSLSVLVLLSEELELATANLEFDDEVDTRVSNIALPFQTVFRPWGEEETGVYLEGVLGYASLAQATDDLYAGQVPGFETSVYANWRSIGAHLGVGLACDVAKGFTLTPIVFGGIARIESRADYGGPGAEFTSELLDGIALNWDAWSWGAGLGLRGDWIRPLGPRHTLELVGRYDLGWFGMFDTDDPAQEFDSRAQIATLRADAVGPVGVRLFKGDLHWRAILGYRHFFEMDLFGTDNLLQVGGGLELDIDEIAPVGSRLSVTGALFFGENVTGWSVGVGFSF
jgi:hypothetical protein